MKDLISRQAAIIVVNKNRDSVFRTSVHYEDAVYDISNLPSVQPEQRWIPCSERLPEYGVSVLTYDGNCFCVEKRIPFIRDETGEAISSDWWVSDDYDESYDGYYPNLRDGACIAWMPLPEPYKMDEV